MQENQLTYRNLCNSFITFSTYYKKYSLLEAYKLKEVVMKVVQIPEPLWAEMTQPLGHPLGAKWFRRGRHLEAQWSMALVMALIIPLEVPLWVDVPHQLPAITPGSFTFFSFKFKKMSNSGKGPSLYYVSKRTGWVGLENVPFY